MNLIELKKKIEALPYKYCRVSYNEGYQYDSYVIDCISGNIWRYYFVDERQIYGKEYRFSSEEELCENFYNFFKRKSDEHIEFVANKQKTKNLDKEVLSSEKEKIIYL